MRQGKADLEAARGQAAAYKAIAEPGESRFRESGHCSAALEAAGIEALTLGVHANKLPNIFLWAAKFFGIKIPTRSIRVSSKKMDGKMQTAEREIYLLMGKTKCKVWHICDAYVTVTLTLTLTSHPHPRPHAKPHLHPHHHHHHHTYDLS